MIKQLWPMHRRMIHLLSLPLVMAGFIAPSNSLADNNGEWVAAPDLKPGYILVGVDAYKLKHHQIKIKKRKGSRVKVEWIITTFDPKSRDVMAFENQFDCKRNKSRFRVSSNDEWKDWELIKEGTWDESAKEKACKQF